MKLVMKTVFLIMLFAFTVMHTAIARDCAVISNPMLPGVLQYPTYDGYCGSNPAQIPMTFTVTNTADYARSFWMGYSARPFNGVQWLDVPAIQTPVLGIGQSYTRTLILNFPDNAPTSCWYNIDIGVWSDMAWNGLLSGECDHKTFYKAFFMENCTVYVPREKIACAPR